MAKLGKATWDAYNLGGWLILQALLKNWVAEGVASEVNDSTQGPLITASHPRKQYFLLLFSIFSHS